MRDFTDAHDPGEPLPFRARADDPGDCRRCGNTRWISASRDTIGRPIHSLDEARVPCARCNPDGVLVAQPLPPTIEGRRA